ncbi:MAG: holo-ACP synthase [Gammaproteobacteria bacterium]|nr:holo-ACP synthase [Gammaproteobacteria bacterium]MCW9031371.1 holo-ACP synthase [Gammaproteobacteria bacterium]
MIFGIGTDIVHVQRMRDSLEKYGDKFARRILTEREFSEFTAKQNKAAFLAKRFAAKEATAKAMGTGFSQGLSLHHIGVKNDESGKPSLEFLDVAAKFLQDNKIQQMHLSLADEHDYAVAFVTLVL